MTYHVPPMLCSWFVILFKMVSAHGIAVGGSAGRDRTLLCVTKKGQQLRWLALVMELPNKDKDISIDS